MANNKLESNNLLDDEDVSSKFVEAQFPERIIFPKELNKFLQDRINDLTAENECLRQAFEQAEEKLHKLSQEKINLQNTVGKPTEQATTKLIELGKKYRNQTAEVEILKTKCKNLEATLVIKNDELERQKVELQQILKSEKYKNSDDNRNQDNIEEKDSSSKDEQIKCLKNKLQRVQTKLCESRNTCAALRQEINKAQKLLYSEVGENVNINTLSSIPGSWRGRAEQIRNLQQKVSDLQIRLSEHEKSQKESSVALDRQNLANLRIVEKERRQQIDNTAKELRQAEVALETSKRKLDASKARIKVLEHELNIAKGNIAILNEKRSHDDRLIDALNERLKIVEARYQECEIEVQNKEHKIERENANIKNELRATQLHVDQLSRRLEEREIELDKLKNGIMSDEPLKCQTSLRSDLRPKQECQISLLTSPRNLGEPNEYITLALAAEAERVRLLELVTVLNQRLDKERNEANALIELLHKEKSKCAKLESKVRNLEKERVGLAKVDSGYRAKSYTKMLNLKPEEEIVNSEEIRFKIELLEEECLALKARLDTVQQDKISDLAMYKRMLDQARKIFKDACRNKSSVAGGSRSTITI
ncbi:coiled-coil domain-containing protein 13 [Anoplolepis gracilipes]|uniref:coiled-coil domain-containing protein 13 n=1 Tax=Anoplolepis gracilipes TaxID=354296 RepID=UPI003BA3D422